jgi:hypothetical protein
MIGPGRTPSVTDALRWREAAVIAFSFTGAAFTASHGAPLAQSYKPNLFLLVLTINKLIAIFQGFNLTLRRYT